MNTQRVPGAWTVLRAQLGLLVGTKYVIGLLMFQGICLFGMRMLMPETTNMPPWMVPPPMAVLYVSLVGIGGIAAALVWINEGPRSRRYHWSLPVTRELHDVLRIAAGAFWLIVTLAIGGFFGFVTESAVVREQWLLHAPIFWAGAFLVSLLAYLLVTVATLLAGRPLFWVSGVILIAILLRTQTVERYAPPLADLGLALVSERHPPSLGVALAGGADLAPWNDSKEKYRVYRATADEYFAANRTSPRVRAMIDADMKRSRAANTLPFTRGEWIASMLAWYLVALLGIGFAVMRRPNV